MSHLWVLFSGTTEITTQFSLEDCTWLYSLPSYQSLFFAANNSKKLHKAARVSVKISCCTACRTPGLGKPIEREFEPLGAVFANLHRSFWATGYTSWLDWSGKPIFCLLLQSMEFMRSVVSVWVTATWELDIEWPSLHRGCDGASSHG